MISQSMTLSSNRADLYANKNSTFSAFARIENHYFVNGVCLFPIPIGKRETLTISTGIYAWWSNPGTAGNWQDQTYTYYSGSREIRLRLPRKWFSVILHNHNWPTLLSSGHHCMGTQESLAWDYTTYRPRCRAQLTWTWNLKDARSSYRSIRQSLRTKEDSKKRINSVVCSLCICIYVLDSGITCYNERLGVKCVRWNG